MTIVLHLKAQPSLFSPVSSDPFVVWRLYEVWQRRAECTVSHLLRVRGR